MAFLMTDDKTKRMYESEPTLRMPPRENHSENSNRDETLQIGSIFNGYEVQGKFPANSGEAEIYITKRNSKKFIIKHYYPNFKPKFEILERLKGIDHPDIINLYEYGIRNDRFFEIMDFAEGGSLADKDLNGNFKYLPMAENIVLGVIKEIVNAFDYCHTKGIIHRDIKPGNLFYKNADGSDILVGDFGISSELDLEGGMSKRITTTSRTEGYAAPEIYSGIIGKEIDYYALGITIFELLTGVMAFAGRNEGHIMRDTIQGRVIEDLLSREEAKNFSSRMQLLIKGLLTVRHDKRWGYDEVTRFLKGETINVFQEKFTNIPPLRINDIQSSDLGEIARALAKYPEPSKKMLYRGLISRWAEFDAPLALKIGDIAEENNTYGRQDYGLYQLIYLLDPTYPYKTEDGNIIRTFEDLKYFIFNNNKFIYNDLITPYSQLYAWLKYKNLDEFIKVIEKTNQLKYTPKKYNSVLQLSFMQEGFITYSDKTILLKNLNSFLTLKDSQKELLLCMAKEQDSSFSMWMEVNSDKKIYNIWFGGNVKQDLKHFLALIKGELILHEGIYLTEDEKSESVRREIQIREIEDYYKKNHIPSLPFSKIMIAILFHIFVISLGILFYLKEFNLALILGLLYLIVNGIYISTKRQDLIFKSSTLKISNKEVNFIEARELSRMNGKEIISIEDMILLYESKSKIKDSNNKELENLFIEDCVYWSSTSCGENLYLGFNFKTGEKVFLHESRKAKNIFI